MTWTAGHMLGSYELQSPLGAGGVGEVWKARDTRLNRTVAIKGLKAQHSAETCRVLRAKGESLGRLFDGCVHS